MRHEFFFSIYRCLLEWWMLAQSAVYDSLQAGFHFRSGRREGGGKTVFYSLSWTTPADVYFGGTFMNICTDEADGVAMSKNVSQVQQGGHSSVYSLYYSHQLDANFDEVIPSFLLIVYFFPRLISDYLWLYFSFFLRNSVQF